MGYRKPRVYKIRIGPGTFAGFSRQETLDVVREAFAEISKFANVDFPESKRPRFTINFYNNAQMRKLAKGKWTALGLQFRRFLAINSERKIKRFQAVAVVKHEALHWLGMKHSDARDATMHPTRSNEFMNAYERAWIQRRYGKRHREFWHTFPDGYKALMREV